MSFRRVMSRAISGVAASGCARVAALVLLVSTAGCNVVPVGIQDPVARAGALAAFRAGEAQMQCGRGLDCAVRWNEAKPAASRLVVAQRWDDVADVVLGAGYDQDLTWFYLGLAAEGVGQAQAARVYYDNAVRRSLYGAGYACVAAGMSTCDGVRLPDDAQKLLAANEARQKAAGRNRAAAAATAGLSPAAQAYVRNLAQIRAMQLEPQEQRMAGAPGQPAPCPTNYRC